MSIPGAGDSSVAEIDLSWSTMNGSLHGRLERIPVRPLIDDPLWKIVVQILKNDAMRAGRYGAKGSRRLA
jgi:hypothetical protein